jgi:methyl-accepting chemotaxis protein
MKLQKRFVLSISVGIVGVLLVSETVRHSWESSQMADFEKSSPERMEVAIRNNLAPIAQAVQFAVQDAMADGNMELLGKILVRQGAVEGVLEAAIYDLGGKVTHASSNTVVGRHMDTDVLAKIKSTGKRFDRRMGDIFEIYQPFIADETCLPCHADWKQGQVGGVLGVHVSNHSFLRAQTDWLAMVKSLRESNVAVGAVVSLGLVATLVLIVNALVGRLMIRPLAAATRFVERISRGDLTQDIDEAMARRSDEFGSLAAAMAAMTSSLRELLGSILSGVRTIGATSNALSAVAAQTASGVEHMGNKSNAAVRAAQGSLSDVQHVATAITEASETIASAARSTDHMRSSIVTALRESEQAKQTTSQATAKAASISASIGNLDQAAQAIGQVTETINGISAQTNLLALNATIEAARAGALGKGFAVVATEIKDLAEQTARATQDVKQKIADVQTSTATALVELNAITEVISDVGTTVSATASAMTEHAEVSQRVVEQLGDTATRVTNAKQDVSSSAEASSTIAAEIGEVNKAAGEIRQGGEQVQEKARDLQQLARNLTALAEQFKLPGA